MTQGHRALTDVETPRSMRDSVSTEWKPDWAAPSRAQTRPQHCGAVVSSLSRESLLDR